MTAASTTMRSVRREIAPASARDARLRLMIASGGDDRLWLDPVTRRNRYGCPAAPTPGELWFSSSTASCVSPRGWDAAGDALDAITSSLGIAAWFDDLRRRLLGLYGAPGCAAVLAASGTEAELVILQLAQSLAGGPLTNIVVAPAETGSGVPAAASGRHFLGRASLGSAVAKAERLAGWEDRELTLETVEIRSPCGSLRHQDEVDQEAARKVRCAVNAGSFALLHVLDASKTGRQGVSRAAAAHIVERHAGRALVVVDACQLRCDSADIRRDLEAGFAVMITGSKFAGGPAFCGALLLPANLAAQLSEASSAGPALAPYSAALDWPAALRGPFAAGLAHPANLGLGLRWSAALAEIEAFERISTARRAALLGAFEQAVRARVADEAGLILADATGDGGSPGLLAIQHADGSDPRTVYEALGEGVGNPRPCHLGQPVAVGPRTALRLCASMPMISDAAEHGFSAIEADLDEAFGSWAALRARR
ncbi:MAG TPA: hypothetical protein VGI95_20625 [Caulobacteraceae bacterium]|jgi:hypothetical protein